MNKQELLENYTMEQLADKVIELEKIIDDKLGGWSKHGISYNDFFSMRDEIESLKEKLQRKETIINQIDDILNELFGVTHDIAKPNDFKEILKEKVKNSKTIVDFLPTEPIKVADMLISAEIQPRKNENGTELVFETRNFNTTELRQIAEHLLIYCDVNEGR